MLDPDYLVSKGPSPVDRPTIHLQFYAVTIEEANSAPLN